MSQSTYIAPFQVQLFYGKQGVCYRDYPYKKPRKSNKLHSCNTNNICLFGLIGKKIEIEGKNPVLMESWCVYKATQNKPTIFLSVQICKISVAVK